MISLKQIAFIRSLRQKKFREQHSSFLVEGNISILELLQSSYKISVIYCTSRYLENYSGKIQKKRIELIEVDQKELERISILTNNTAGVAIVQIDIDSKFLFKENEITLILDGINEPGNFGTILRIADWYGINQIICSEDTVDLFNPKVIHASMGSFCRVKVIYKNLPDFLEQYKQSNIFGAVLAGKNIHTIKLTAQGFLIIGNEIKGISPEVKKFVTLPLTIPRFGKAESLNAAMATAILCDNFFRNL